MAVYTILNEEAFEDIPETASGDVKEQAKDLLRRMIEAIDNGDVGSDEEDMPDTVEEDEEISDEECRLEAARTLYRALGSLLESGDGLDSLPEKVAPNTDDTEDDNTEDGIGLGLDDAIELDKDADYGECKNESAVAYLQSVLRNLDF